jgi:hypothetical protein
VLLIPFTIPGVKSSYGGYLMDRCPAERNTARARWFLRIRTYPLDRQGQFHCQNQGPNKPSLNQRTLAATR